LLGDNLKLIENLDEDCLKVYTLGHFSVKSGKKVLSDDCKRSQQVWNLFKYILTYRNKGIIQENFFDVLWSDKECDNPVKALQNLIYRLRLILNYDGVKNDGESIINYSQGCYSWNNEFHYWIDIDEFEDLYKKAIASEKNDDYINAIEFYERALILYKGDYLSEDSYNEWVTPVRNYYHRIYMDIIDKLIGLLKHYSRNQDILKVCEDALMIEQFEENIHILYIEALIEVGFIKQAQSQYQYVTSMLYKQMGVKPSTKLRNLYHQIKYNDDKALLDIDSIKEMMTDRQDDDGAFFCERDTFISFYKLECRRIARSEQVVSIAMLTIYRVKNRNQNNIILKKAMGSLLDMLIQGLRKGDVVTKWSEAQILVLLPGATFEKADMVLTRILNKYDIAYATKDLVIKTLLQPIKSLDKESQ
jgi:DNA-binding SARP family transcriptional activator